MCIFSDRLLPRARASFREAFLQEVPGNVTRHISRLQVYLQRKSDSLPLSEDCCPHSPWLFVETGCLLLQTGQVWVNYFSYLWLQTKHLISFNKRVGWFHASGALNRDIL